MKRQSILFVSHSASRNGATILLLSMLRWLREHTDHRLEVVMCSNGELIDEFRAVCETRVWRSPAALLNVLPRRWKTAAWVERLNTQFLKWRMAGRYYDLVYFNTSAVAAFVPVLVKHANGSLWHIHELDYVLRLNVGAERLKDLFPLATRFISVSQSVSNALTERFTVSPSKLDLVHGFVPIPSVTADDARFRRQRVRDELGLADNTFVVGGCGALGWRKGTDIFLQVAHTMCHTRGDKRSHFLWVGGETSGDEALRFAHDIRAFGLDGRCQTVASTARVMDYYCAMDAFALTSREDPFPLVMLEAGFCQLPVVCFAGTGGAPEFVGDDAGLIAPYLNVEAFTTHLETLRDNPDLRQRFSAGAAAKVRGQYVIETQGPKLLASIHSCLPVIDSAE